MLGFPIWIRICHFINLVAIFFLMRSGIQILADHPKLYWNDNTTPGSEWIKFTKKKMPKDKLWTSLDEAEGVSSIIGFPGGRHNLGSGRRWHFFFASILVANGIVYIILLFLTGEWRRLIPTDPAIFAQALHTFLIYITFHVPPVSAFHPYDALQQLAYASVVFIVGPFMIITGIAMSSAVIAHFPEYLKLFGGRRQAARSFHFLGLIALILFVIIHVSFVSIVYANNNIRNIVFGSLGSSFSTALEILSFGLVLLILAHIILTWLTLKYQRVFQRFLDPYLNILTTTLFGHLTSRQNYKKKDISPYFRVNGYPPETEEYKRMLENNFTDWKLKIEGLVENPQELSLVDIKNLPKQEQITKHNCIQGWSAVGEWGGVKISDLMKIARPNADAKFVVFHAYDISGEGIPYYESLTIEEALDPQSILAYEMNWESLPIPHGAPLRLRAEIKLGFKMVKYIKSVEFIKDLADLGKGYGGYKEDYEFFERVAAI